MTMRIIRINVVVEVVMSSPACRHVTLAKNAAAHVQRCTECGCISIHIGPTTLRVDATVLEALGAVLGEAATSLCAERRLEMTFRGVA